MARLSPRIMVFSSVSLSKPTRWLPSTSTRSGETPRPDTADRIARSVAWSMFILSMIPGWTAATQKVSAETRSLSEMFSRTRSGSFFESSTPLGMFRGSRITAPATTGPATAPLPASSTPAIAEYPALRISDSSARRCESVEICLVRPVKNAWTRITASL